MPAAVVPFQVDGRKGQRQALVQDAFQILMVGILFIIDARFEERGRGQLLVVADDALFPWTISPPAMMTGMKNWKTVRLSPITIPSRSWWKTDGNWTDMAHD